MATKKTTKQTRYFVMTSLDSGIVYLCPKRAAHAARIWGTGIVEEITGAVREAVVEIPVDRRD